MRELSLFTGAGGGILGSKLLGWTTIGYVEWNDYCQRVLRQRIEDGLIDNAPIFGDIRAFLNEGYARSYSGMVDIITAGFPCQPFSVAGKRLAENDERNMWPETRECIRTIRPRFALLENVPGLLSSGYFGTVLGELSEIGYDARWRVLSAAEMGAPHKRDRLWIVANSRCESERCESNRFNNKQLNGATEKFRATQRDGFTNGGKDVADTNSQGFPSQRIKTGLRKTEREACASFERGGLLGNKWNSEWWAVEPDVGRVANGVARRVDRLKAIGNGQVPAVVRAAWNILSEGLIW